MRAKFTVVSVTRHRYGSQEVAMEAVHDTSPENNQFAKATPSGKLTMWIDNTAAHGFLEPGKDYYLDFTPAE